VEIDFSFAYTHRITAEGTAMQCYCSSSLASHTRLGVWLARLLFIIIELLLLTVKLLLHGGIATAHHRAITAHH
jgi:hypothetical protein